MPEAPTLHRQRALASLILDPEPAPADLGEGLRVYRDLVRAGLEDAVESALPITRVLLGEADAWDEALDAFLAARCVASRHHRDIAPAFLGWLAATGWGLDRWPFLLELAHWELLELLVCRWDDRPPPSGLDPVPGPGSRIVLDPAAQLVSYTHAVQRATEEDPIPSAGATHLLAFRDKEGDFQVLELTPATAYLLTGAQTRPLGDVLEALGLQEPGSVRHLLEDLRGQGALAGFLGGADRE